MPFLRAVPVHLRVTPRPTYWRIAIILPGRILWRTYSREAYPEAEAALERCLAGLFTEQERQQHPQAQDKEGGVPDVH